MLTLFHGSPQRALIPYLDPRPGNPASLLRGAAIGRFGGTDPDLVMLAAPAAPSTGLAAWLAAGTSHGLTASSSAAVSVTGLAECPSARPGDVCIDDASYLTLPASGAQDVVLGSPVSGRLHEEIASLLGFFTNTLALRTDLSGDPSFAELLARVKRTTLEARAHQELPFEKLVEVLNPERSQSHEPIFQVLFGFDVVPGGHKLAGCRLEALPLPAWQWSRFDLTIVLHEGADGSLCAYLEYSTDLFDACTIERLIGHYQTLLGAVADGP